MKPLNIAIILGSTRDNRLGIRAAKFIESKLKKEGHKTNLVDPIKHKLPLLKKRYIDYKSKAPKTLTTLHKILDKADAFVIVSAEYNHSIPPALSNLLDHFYAEYSRKPAGIVSYSVGGFAGIRAAAQLRMLLGALGMPAINNAFPISNLDKSIDEKGNDTTEKKDYDKRIAGFIEELTWYATALKNHRTKTKYKYSK